MKKVLFFLSFLLMSVGMWSADVEFTPSNSGGMSSTAGNISGTKNGITISISNGVNNGNDIRVYKSATMTITSTVGNITNINFTYSGSNNGGWATSYTPNTSSWTSPTASGTQARCTRIVVTYSGSSPTTYTVTYNANGGTGTMTDSNSPYNSGSTVTTLTNTFTRDGYSFSKWNTAANGQGIDYAEGVTFSITQNTTLFAQWTENPTPIVAGKVYELVTDINDLQEDNNIIILDIDKEYAMSVTQNPNNRGASQDFRLIMNKTVAVLNDPSTVQPIRLGKTNNNWTFYTGTGGYLYAAGNSDNQNYLRTQTTNNTNGQWSISIDPDTYEASVVAQGSNSHKVMQYNSGSSLFACYLSASQKGLYIYKESNFSETFTITFVNQLGVDSTKTQSTIGEIITLPSTMNICNKCYGSNWSLEGWVTSLETTSPVYTNDYIPTHDITLYALYGRGSVQTVEVEEYKKVTTSLDDWSGDYLIAYSSSRFADGRTSTNNNCFAFINPDINLVGDTVVNASWGDQYNVTLEKITDDGNTYLLKTKDDLYNYATTSNNYINGGNRTTALTHPITITFNSSNDISIKSEGKEIQYNTGSDFFRFYAKTQKPIYLYKRQVVQKPVSQEHSTSPECDTTYITTWDKNKICIDKYFLDNVNEQNVTVKDITTGETLLNNASLTYQSTSDTYEIPLSLASRACDKLNILLSGSDSLYMIYKVPFIVDADSYTSSMIDENCDVVVLPNTTLTLPTGMSSNRDVKLYQGSHLSVPSGATYNVNSLSFRKDNETVSTLGLTGTLNAEHLYLDLYFDYKDWNWMALPHEYNFSNLRFTHGRKTKYREDIYIKRYDGKHRAQTQSGSWAAIPGDTTFSTGNGFIIGLADDLIKKEVRFELNTDAIDDETDNKSVGHMYAWGGNNSSLRPNHKGWNLVGNPFLNSVVTDLASPIHIDSLVKVMNGDKWTGQWEWSGSARGSQFRYGVFPSDDPRDADAGGYKSVVLDDIKLDPFVCFFVQIGGDSPNTNQAIMFNAIDRGPLMTPRRYAEEDKELFLRVKVDDWKTGCFISNNFTDEYEPGDDLESRYPIYQSIGGYKLLYSAVNDSIIENGVKVITPSGHLYLDSKVNIEQFEYIQVFYKENWYDLMIEELDVEGEFILYAKRKINNVATGLDNNYIDSYIKYMDRDHNVYFKYKNHIYTIDGKLKK